MYNRVRRSRKPLFPYTTLIDWFVRSGLSVFTARYGLEVYVKFMSFSVFKELRRRKEKPPFKELNAAIVTL